MKTIKNIYPQIIAFSNLFKGFKRTSGVPYRMRCKNNNVLHVPPERVRGMLQAVPKSWTRFFITMMTDIKKIKRKKRKPYNIEGHAHNLTFSCYHQCEYLNDPQCCTLFTEELWSARARPYQKGLLPDDFDLPLLIM